MIRALLIEDCEGDAELLRLRLQDTSLHASLTLTHVTTMAAAEETLRHSTFDLVIADMHLPDEREEALVGRVRAITAEAAIVVLTGCDEPRLAERALQAGAQDYLSKDRIDARQLERALRYAMERQAIHARLAEETQRARRSEASFRATLAGIQEAVVVTNGERIVRFANEAAASLLGSGATVGRTLGLVCSREPGEYSVDWVAGPGKSLRRLNVRVSPIAWNGAPALLVSIVDLTPGLEADAIRARLAQSEQLAAVGQVAAGVAHEINNPAAYVTGNLSCLADELRTTRTALGAGRKGADPGLDSVLWRRLGELENYVHDARIGMERIGAVVGSLREFSRVNVDDAVTLDLREVVASACRLVANQVEQRATLELKAPDPVWVVGHAERLTRVVANVVLNAAQSFSDRDPEHNRIVIAVALRGSQAQLTVADNGPGIEAEDLGRIFTPFFTTKPSRDGLGLGLTVAQDVVTRHGGEIRAVSDPESGARIHVDLPAAAPPAQPARPAPARVRTRPRVLIVDDEQMICRAYERMLAPRYDAISASNGETALELLERSSDYDCIVCDIAMPVMDGPAFLAALEQQHPALCNRVLFVTGGAFTSRAENFLATTQRPVLHKPLTRRQLETEVAAVATPAERTSRASVPDFA